MRVTEAVGATTLSYFPGTDGLMYWKEGYLTDSVKMIATVQDLNGNGIIDMYIDPAGTTLGFGSYQVSLTSHPSAGIDAAGNIYLSYSSIYEGIDDQGAGGTSGTPHTGKDYRHTFVTSSKDGGIRSEER